MTASHANIERQFEFVQHAWITSPNFAGLYDEADPLLGGRTVSPGAFTIPGCPVRQRLQGILPHIATVGGAYFFLPGLRALRWLGR
jgi:deferrochelatase/peroxidase EfeB